VNIQQLRDQIVSDLRTLPNGREYSKVSDKLRSFVNAHIPEAEIVKVGRKFILRLKGELK